MERANLISFSTTVFVSDALLFCTVEQRILEREYYVVLMVGAIT